MKASFVIFLAFAHIAFLVGCEKSEKTDDSHPSQVGGNHFSSNTVDTAQMRAVSPSPNLSLNLWKGRPHGFVPNVPIVSGRMSVTSSATD